VDLLAWEIAETAQSCAYLAIELQVWASRSYGQAQTSAGWTYRPLFDSVRIFRALLINMHKRFVEINGWEENNAVCVISEDLAEAILSTLVVDKATTLAECMTRPEKAETQDTGTAGDMK
jgi:hypothetical protein